MCASLRLTSITLARRQLGDVTNYLLIKVKVSFLSFQRPKTSVNGTTTNSVNEHQSAAAGISNGTVNLASFVIKSHENERKVAEIARYQIPIQIQESA